MLSTIAVATDGSETAQLAVDAAFDLAQRYDAAIVILTAFVDERNSGSGSGWAANSASRAERVLAAVEDAAAQRGLTYSSAMSHGEPGDVIVALAERHGADLLIVGNKGMDRRVLGSVPNTVTHKATCSVFVVKTV